MTKRKIEDFAIRTGGGGTQNTGTKPCSDDDSAIRTGGGGTHNTGSKPHSDNDSAIRIGGGGTNTLSSRESDGRIALNSKTKKAGGSF